MHYLKEESEPTYSIHGLSKRKMEVLAFVTKYGDRAATLLGNEWPQTIEKLGLTQNIISSELSDIYVNASLGDFTKR